jgi:hypothetical protein
MIFIPKILDAKMRGKGERAKRRWEMEDGRRKTGDGRRFLLLTFTFNFL